MIKELKTLMWALICSHPCSLIGSAESDPTLSFEDIFHAGVATERAISGVTTFEDQVFYLGIKSKSIVKAGYTASEAQLAEKAFRFEHRMATGQKLTIVDQIQSASWHGLAMFNADTVLAMDVSKHRVVGYSVSRRGSLIPGYIVVDLLKPPNDSRGEPTKVETQAFRKKFMAAFNRVDSQNQVFAGLTRLPKNFVPSNEIHFLVLTRIKSFPLLRMKCLKDSPTQCQMIEGCFVEGLHGEDPKAFTGLAINANGVIIIGDREHHRLLQLKYDSCFHIYYRKRFILPKKLPAVSAIHLDNSDNLWLTTFKPDNYLNSSIFVFKPQIWQN